MPLRSRCAGVILGTALLSACHGFAETPSGPSAAPPTLRALTVTPAGGGTILVGTSAPVTTSGGRPSGGAALGAFAEYSDGSGRYVEATWTSSDDAVLALVGDRLRARAPGTATITATFQGLSDSETFAVEPGVPGTWAGTYRVQQCQANSGSMDDLLCSAPIAGRPGGVLRPGTTLPIVMQITQDDSTSAIAGTVALGEARGALAGVNRGGGFFYLLGDLAAPSGLVRIGRWDTQVTKDAMQGTISFQVEFTGVRGAGLVTVALVDVTRR